MFGSTRAALLTAVLVLVASSAAEAGPRSYQSSYENTISTTRYVVEIEWWHFDRDHRFWQEVDSSTDYTEALWSLMFHEWLLDTGRVRDLYDQHWHYIPVDVRLRSAPLWQLSPFDLW